MDLAGIPKGWVQDVARAAEFVTLINDEERLLYVNHPQPGCEDYAGQSVFDFVDPNYHEALRQSVRRARAEGTPQQYESDAAGPNGFELAERVRSSMPELPVVFVSGFPAEAEDHGEQYEVRQKPFTTEQLAATVRRAFR